MKFLTTLLVIGVVQIFGQTEVAPSKFDEIENLPNSLCSDCELKVEDRVDRFATYLKRNGRGKQIFIIHYRARILEEDKKHRLGNWVNLAKWRLADSPVGHDNVFVIDGGFREFDTLELWIAPKGSSGPSPKPKYSRAEAIDCPSIGVFQKGMAFDRTIEFTIWIRPKGNYSYEWSVDKGKIEGSYNTDLLKVDLAETNARTVTAFLKVSGVPIPCKNTFIAVGETGNTPKLIDEFGRIQNGDFKARMDSFYITLANYPGMQGYVYFYGDRKEASKDVRGNKARLINYVTIRRLDQSRLTIVDAGFREEQMTQFWLVPPDVQPPTPTANERFIKRPANRPLKLSPKP